MRQFPNTYNMNNKPLRPGIKKAINKVSKGATKVKNLIVKTFKK